MEQWLEDFKRTIHSASPLLRQMGDEQSEQSRAEGHWSSKQIIGHLIDSAANNHARFILGQLKDDLVFPGYDQNSWVRTNHYQEAPWSQLVDLWQAYNLHLHHVMAHASEEKMSTPCTLHTLEEIAFNTIPKSDPVTLKYLMQDYLAHLKHHLAQILGEVMP